MPWSRGKPGGNRTYFPFFSDFKGHNVTALRIGESSALASIFLLSLAGNIWGICLLVRRHRRLCAANCLVLNLFCADLLFITALLGSDIQICTLDWPSTAGEIVWDTTFATVFFLIPGLVIVISYSKILQITKASRRSLNAGLAYSEHHQIRVSQQDYKLFRALFLLMISFFIMWSPIIVIIFLILVQNYKKDLNILPSVFFWITLFTFANSAVNPILYNVAHFRRKCQEILLCCTGNPERHGAGTETTARRSNREQPHLSFITR
ncbi:PREDICTED: free fatty acid receptor 4 [Corvus brachyrhynchos]|uniref:free fatty acid receptor 4 n=1 Tax=Corvus brachyrhynchos TaxID=85066 RepID=UPI0008166908|nr:PREDICTED: free fatty acid receptor 4 [Corvus brachyrhynchos]